MTVPFFSVVIPTKNRIEPLKITIESILAQEYPDFECVIVDNNDDGRLDGLCEGYQDSRLRRVKTGGLNMADNWDAALRTAQGQYVILIEDKQCLYGHALLMAHTIIQKTGTEAVIWNSDVADDRDPSAIKVGRGRGSRRLKKLMSDDVLDEFTFQKPHRQGKGSGYAYFLPTFIVGCLSAVKTSALNDIRFTTGSKVCLPVNPSFTMGCHLINRLDSYYCFDGSLSLIHSVKTSTGGNWHEKKLDANNFWKDLGGPEIAFSHVPIKASFNENTPCNDYLAMTQLLGGRLARHPVNWPIYYVLMYELNARNHRSGLNRSEELKAWKAALRRESWEIQLPVTLRLFRNSLRRFFKSTRSTLGLPRLEKLLKRKYGQATLSTDRRILDLRDFVRQETARLRELDMRNLF